MSDINFTPETDKQKAVQEILAVLEKYNLDFDADYDCEIRFREREKPELKVVQ